MALISFIKGGWGGGWRSGVIRKTKGEKADLLLSSSPRSPFLLNQIFQTDRSGLLSSPLSLHPSFSISSFSIHHPPHCCSSSPSPSCFSLNIPHPPPALTLSVPPPPLWGAADAVPIATIGSMFAWYACDPLITLLAADNNSKSHTADREMRGKETC